MQDANDVNVAQRIPVTGRAGRPARCADAVRMHARRSERPPTFGTFTRQIPDDARMPWRLDFA